MASHWQQTPAFGLGGGAVDSSSPGWLTARLVKSAYTSNTIRRDLDLKR